MSFDNCKAFKRLQKRFGIFYTDVPDNPGSGAKKSQKGQLETVLTKNLLCTKQFLIVGEFILYFLSEYNVKYAHESKNTCTTIKENIYLGLQSRAHFHVCL